MATNLQTPQGDIEVRPAILSLPLEVREIILRHVLAIENTIHICSCVRTPYYSTIPIIKNKSNPIPVIAPSMALVNRQLHHEVYKTRVRDQITNVFIFCSWDCVSSHIKNASPRSRALLHKICVTWPERRYFPGVNNPEQEIMYAQVKEKLLRQWYGSVSTVRAESADRQGSWVTVTVEMEVGKPRSWQLSLEDVRHVG